MKISLITSVPINPPWDQGDKNLAYTLARVLPEYRFQILTAQGAPQPEGENLVAAPLFGSTQPSLGDKASVYWWFWRQNNGNAADLYHFVYRPYALSSWMARLVPQFRSRPTLHTVPATTAEEPLARHLFFADRVVALSRHGVQHLRNLGVENVEHIPTAIGVQRWASLQGKTAYFKEQLGLKDRPTLLFPGHYGPGYGADVLLQALPLIAQEVPGVQVIFACRPRSPGDAEREKEARQLLQEAGLAHNARFYNVVEEMQLLIGAADLTVLPLETMRDKVDIPTTLLESLAAAKPVVISDLAPMNELMEEGGASVGRLVPPGDARALAENVVALLLDGEQRASMGRCGHSLMLERYDIKAVAKQYANLYREMTS